LYQTGMKHEFMRHWRYLSYILTVMEHGGVNILRAFLLSEFSCREMN